MVDTILIDFDGTLMNTRQGIIDSWRYIFKKVKNIDVDEEFLKDTFGETIEETLAKYLPEITIEEGIAIYREYRLVHNGEMMAPFDGMCEMIDTLKAQGYNIALVTSRDRESTDFNLKKFDLGDKFDITITANDVKEPKPSSEPIDKALEFFGTKPQNAIMIGDTMFDLMASKNAGVVSCLVAWSEDIAEEYDGEYKPYYIMHKANDIFEFIK